VALHSLQILLEASSGADVVFEELPAILTEMEHALVGSNLQHSDILSDYLGDNPLEASDTISLAEFQYV
jgi:hypothetical protein